MGFKCGIIGLPNVGKSTLFNALTESNKAEAANYPFATIEPNIGRVPVPDERLNILATIGKSEKIIPSYMDFVDIAGLVKGASQGEGLGNKFLGHIREVDAIAHVVRCFNDENITHVSNIIDPINDIETINTELQLADIETLESKKTSLEKKSKQGDKETLHQIKIIEKIIENLNHLSSLQKNDFTEKDNEFVKTLNIIAIKPMLYICNVDEESVKSGNEMSKKVSDYANKKNHNAVIVSASIESQIAELENNDEKLEMLKGYLLSKIQSEEKRNEANDKWKNVVIKLKNEEKDHEEEFAKSLLRSRYARDIRERKRGAVKKDFDLIGTEFHKWVRDNETTLKLGNGNWR